jgi:hypothetical protein
MDAETRCMLIFNGAKEAVFSRDSGVNIAIGANLYAHRIGLPLSRLSIAEIRQQLVTQGLVVEISDATLWRWLSNDALPPWRHRSRIFPRDAEFAAKAGRVLDQYQRLWEGRPLGADEFVLLADEKTSVQARRKQPTLAPAFCSSMRVEHESFREGTWTYLAAWDATALESSVAAKAKMASGPADQALDIRALKDVLAKNGYGRRWSGGWWWS